jgi:PAS domain S-box-containing protein
MTPRIFDLPDFLLGNFPTWPEISAVFNLIPEAALLFNAASQKIAFANRKYLELSTYTLDELIGKPCGEALEGFSLSNLAAGQRQSLRLKKRLTGFVDVMVEPVFLAEAAGWVVLKVEESLERPRALRVSMDSFELLLKLVKQNEIHSENELYALVMDVLSRFLGTDLICIYRVDSSQPQALRVALKAAAEVFPPVLSSADMIRLSEGMIWKPGRRVYSELHRLSKMAGLKYVASVPIGQQQAALGLLVVGDVKKDAGFDTEQILNYFRVFISDQLQKFALIDNLRTDSQKKDFSLSVLNSLLEHTEEGIVVLTPDLKVIEINSVAEVLLGYTCAEVCGQSVENVLIGSLDLIQTLEDGLQSLKNHNIAKVSLHRRDGIAVPAQIQVVPVVKNRRPQAMLVLITDLSEEEKIRIRAEQLENHAMLGEFTAVFAHEVRNPINNISTGLQLLASRSKDSEANLELIERAQNDCTRLNELMESVLAFSRPVEPKFQDVNIPDLVQRVLNRWRPRMVRVNIENYFKADEDLPLVKGDMRSLERVFTNLISNAVDVMSEKGGALSVRVSLKEAINQLPQIEVTVADNGPGIPDSLRERIFEPFVTGKPRGTGLGLAITKQIVTTHRGAIYVTSFPGGTVFHVELPAAT